MSGAITLNGEPRELPADGATLRALLAPLGLDRPGVAAAVNGDPVARAHWERPLAAGDAVLVLEMVAGG